MHILFIANCDTLYGANRSMIELAVELRKLGQEIFFFFPYGKISRDRYLLKKNLNSNKFTYVFLNYVPSVHNCNEKKLEERLFRSTVNHKCLIQMKEYIKKWKIDIIHTNSLTHLVGAVLSRHMFKPHIWHVREALMEDYGLFYDCKFQYKYALWNAERVICISDYVRKIHKKMLFGAKVTTLPNGFDINKYILYNAYQKPHNVYNIIICGVIQEGKGQLDAVKAIDYLVYNYRLKNIYLQIVGDGAGEYYKKIKNYIVINSLQNYIAIIPFQENLKELRKNADIALVCSRNEALGRVTIESMLSENLVIGANTAGTKEIIKDGVNGYLYESGNAHALCKKIYDVIEHWDMQEKVIKNAKKYAVQNYDIKCYAEKILTLYKNSVC